MEQPPAPRGAGADYEVARQARIHGPPRCFTPDRDAAEAAVARLATLEARTLVSGPGPALAGPAMRAGLERLAREFCGIAVA